MARQTIALYHVHHQAGRAVQEYLDALAEALGGARVDGPDDEGFVEVEVEANDYEDALDKVWNAMAAAGADDHLVIAEHPDLPEHWRERAGGPGAPAA
jgi:putative NIF3 family GTP cyclohydrolase 1 type 2